MPSQDAHPGAVKKPTTQRGDKLMKRILPFVLAAGLSLAAVAPAAAAPPVGQFAGAAGLVNVIVQAVVQNVNILNDSDVDVITIDVNNSLNNLLRNADIDVLTNFLNNSLNNLNVDVTITDITVVGGSIIITVLGVTGVTDTIVLS
jgi:hypothetical protein